jgi:hypothetical protein
LEGSYTPSEAYASMRSINFANCCISFSVVIVTVLERYASKEEVVKEGHRNCE